MHKILSFSAPERGTNVMVLQNCSVVVKHRSVRTRHHVKIIRGPRVLVVVYQGRDKSCKNFQIRHPILEI